MAEERDIIALPPGQAAPPGTDYISIERLPNDRFRWSGSVVQGESLTFTEAESATFEDAKRAGYEWAKNRGARLVYVEDGRPDNPRNEP